MPTITDEAICIRHWDYSESSQTVSLFGRRHGMIRGLAKGARRERGRFSGGIDLLTRGEVGAIIKPGRELATLTDWDLRETFWALRHDLGSHRIGLYMADLIYRFVTDHDPHERLYDGLAASLACLRDTETNGRTLMRFQLELLTATGYQPQWGEDPGETETLGFRPEAGSVVEDTGQSDRWRVRAGTISCLRDEDKARTASGETIDRANQLLAAYLRHLLGAEPPTMRLLFPRLRG